MLAPFALILLVTLSPATTDPYPAVVREFVAALERDDRDALSAGGPGPSSVGTAYTLLELYDGIAVSMAQIASIETRGESTVVLVELEGTATAIGTGARVPLPRWWSIEVKPGPGGAKLLSSMTLERRLAADHALRGSRELEAVLRAHAEIDVNRFLNHVASIGADAGLAGCETVLWVVREAQARGEVAAESTAWQMLSYLGTLTWSPSDTLAGAERSLALGKASGSPDLLAEGYFQVGIAHWVAGRIDEAVEALTRSGSYAGRVEDPRLPIRALYMAAYLEQARFRLREALALAERQRVLLARYPFDRARVDNAFTLGIVHHLLGNASISIRHYEEAREIARTQLHDTELETMAVFNMATTGLSAQMPEGGTMLELAYELGKTYLSGGNLATVRLTLALVAARQGDAERAERLLEEALPGALGSGLPAAPATFHVTRSMVRLAVGRLEEAIADARRARELAVAAKLPGYTAMIDALTTEGQALRLMARNGEAEAAWRAAVDFAESDLTERPVDEVGSANVMARLLAPYGELLDLLVEQGCAQEALSIAERMRARSLRESLRHGRVDLSAGLDEAQRAREQELETALAEANRALLAASSEEAAAPLRRQRHDARLALRELRSELYAKLPALERRRADPYAARDTALPPTAPGEVVLELTVNDDALFAFVMRGGAVTAHRIGISREALEEQVDAFVAALEQRDLAYRPPARALYDLLLGPVAADLDSVRTLRIVPDGVLWRLPFQALVDSRGRHLAERIAVSYSPSLTLSRPHRNRESAPRTLLALADPVIAGSTATATRALYRDITLGPLPDAAAEVRAIAPLYAGARVRVRGEAQESAFKSEAPEFRVLHLAAHSIVDDGAPMFSSIVLAPSDGDPLADGLLEAREIAELDLRADLAVLSACETARGAVTPGEGMVGLSWAFLAAGVPTTVVSQWKVASSSTADLMVAFHRGLHRGASAPDALRAAMQAVRADRRWRHPFYWAPFVVIENGSGTASGQ